MKDDYKNNPCDSSLPQWVRPISEGSWEILVYVQPGAKKTEISGEMDGRLKVRVAAQAIDNKANKALMAFIAKTLHVRPRTVRLATGETSRRKTLVISENLHCDWDVLRVSGVPS